MPAQLRPFWSVPVAVYAPVAVTILYSSSTLMLLSVGPLFPVEAPASGVYPAPGVSTSSCLASTPTTPSTSSSPWEVVNVGPAERAVELPVAVADRSRPPWIPEKSSTLIARATMLSVVTVIVFPGAIAVVTGAEKTTVRTPVVSDPFVTSASLV